MKRIPLESEPFITKVLARIDTVSGQSGKKANRSIESLGWIVAAAASLVFLSWFLWDQRFASTFTRSSPQAMVTDSDVRFENTARSKFLGEFSPAVGSAVSKDREYVLTSGSIQIRFSSGAEAIIDAPAVFQVISSERLRLSIGSCSVYAPKGAEGFIVDTPNSKIVDRGTRFAVSVSETAKTEVHVVEGAADIYNRSGSEPGIRLVGKEARSIDGERDFDSVKTAFSPHLFRSQLADRVVSYQATVASSPGGGAEDLTSIQVQRGGVLCDYKASDLIGCDLTWFCIEEILFDNTNMPFRHLASKGMELQNRAEALSDLALNTGAINPGGATEPIRSDPRVDSSDPELPGTPGFAIRFRNPIMNRPGPDIVFFEIQDLPGAPDGDSFHVIPMKYREGLKPLTIKAYDLTLTSPESLKLASFYLHSYRTAVSSLEAFSNGASETVAKPSTGNNYRALAVGIDLSMMGYQEGESIQELFFQDSLDDRKHVDPVLILGLP
jgi:hypothetical protein